VAENHVVCKLKPNEAIPSFLGAFYTLDMEYPTQCQKMFGMLEHIFLPTPGIRLNDTLKCMLSEILS
jgi:hypothetical protein